MELTIKQANELIATKGCKEAAKELASAIVTDGNSVIKSFQISKNGIEVIEKVNLQEKTMEVKDNSIPAEAATMKKATKMSFYQKLSESRTGDRFESKAFPAGATAVSDINAGIVDAVADYEALIWQSPLLDMAQFIPMTTEILRLPSLKIGSGLTAIAPEGSGKNSIQGGDNYVALEPAVYAATLPITNKALRDIPAFSSLLPRLVSTDIKNRVVGLMVSRIKAASGKEQVNVANVSGLPTPTEVITMKQHVFEDGDSTILLAHPTVSAYILANSNASNPSGFLVTYQGPQAYVYGAKLVSDPNMVSPASGASGTFAFVNMNYVGIAQRGEIAEEWNPFYAWDNNGSSIRVEGEFDTAPLTNDKVTYSGYNYAVVVVQN